MLAVRGKDWCIFQKEDWKKVACWSNGLLLFLWPIKCFTKHLLLVGMSTAVIQVAALDYKDRCIPISMPVRLTRPPVLEKAGQYTPDWFCEWALKTWSKWWVILQLHPVQLTSRCNQEHWNLKSREALGNNRFHESLQWSAVAKLISSSSLWTSLILHCHKLGSSKDLQSHLPLSPMLLLSLITLMFKPRPSF